MEYLIFLVSMAALIKGADYVIDESERIALHYNISHFVIGATIVALGTSLPEMAASVFASLNGKSDLAVSNVIGSTIFNIALVLGVVFIITKNMAPKRDMFAEDSAWALFPILVFLVIGFDGEISRWEGFIYILMMGAYLLFLTNHADALAGEIDEELTSEVFDWKRTGLWLGVGFVMVVVGANFTVESASTIARNFGVSEWLIGLFLIALGTSLPELVVSVQAAKKGNADMIIGNIIGSNVANFTVVLGAAAIVSPLSVDFTANAFDIMTALIVTVMMVFIAANKLYNRSSGIVLLLMLALVLGNSFQAL
ncbi:MAG: calcium/sodium antiporter [Epsilonproteobacteria bacterium]|nr:calcium/sodium antiporter [Campylobacterota bacterium]